MLLRKILLRSWIVFVAVSIARIGIFASEPTLVKRWLRIAPTDQQLASLPRCPPRWTIAPAIAANFDGLLKQWQFSPELAAKLGSRLEKNEATGEWIIIPDDRLLDSFTGNERARWQVVLGAHPANQTYRWPISLDKKQWEELQASPLHQEIVQRIKKWGIPSRDRIIFSDVFALESQFSSTSHRLDFFKLALGSEILMPNLKPLPHKEESAAEQASYWQVNGRYRAVQPFLNAIERVQERDRIDLAHLLPKRPRALVYAYPDQFATPADPALENGAMAAGFFDQNAKFPLIGDTGIAGWLEAECALVTDNSRHYGDIVVFEDPSRNRWPYTAIYIADGVVFARRPSMLGPWTYLEIDNIARINPRLSANNPVFYRRRESFEPPFTPQSSVPIPAWAEDVKFSESLIGPWGRLRCYDVLLAPPADLITRLPPPSQEPVWHFRKSDMRTVIKIAGDSDVPDVLKRELLKTLRSPADSRDEGVVAVSPGKRLVFDIPPELRAKLFAYLIHGGIATDYAQDILLPLRGPPASWLPPSVLPDPFRSTFLKLVYPRGESWMLSDYGALYNSFEKAEDRLRVLRAAFRTPALIVLLEKPHPSDAKKWAQYWSLSQRKDIGSLLESFAQNDEAQYIDVVHLLPSLARELSNFHLLSSANDPTASCYWTAFNFASKQEDRRVLVTPSRLGDEGERTWAILQREYQPIQQPSRLGDIVAYRKRGKESVIHLCSYVAADIAFTKNGFGFAAPWCLMRLDDVDLFYKTDASIERIYFRRR